MQPALPPATFASPPPSHPTLLLPALQAAEMALVCIVRAGSAANEGALAGLKVRRAAASSTAVSGRQPCGQQRRLADPPARLAPA